jgi:hypothetical protein
VDVLLDITNLFSITETLRRVSGPVAQPLSANTRVCRWSRVRGIVDGKEVWKPPKCRQRSKGEGKCGWGIRKIAREEYLLIRCFGYERNCAKLSYTYNLF